MQNVSNFVGNLHIPIYTERNLYPISFHAGIPYITDCVMAEIEKLGMKYRVALRYE